MQQESLDHVLAKDAEIVPSSGFTNAVMEAVRGEASVPLPIPFPWKRALPGLVLSAFALMAAVFVPLQTRSVGGIETSVAQLTELLTPMLAIMRMWAVNWLVAALLLSWGCVRLAMGLASWRS